LYEFQLLKGVIVICPKSIENGIVYKFLSQRGITLYPDLMHVKSSANYDIRSFEIKPSLNT